MARIETLTGRRRRRGLTLIEAALVLGIITMIFGGLASILGETMENQRSKNVADRMRELLTASEKYVNARLSAIRLNGPGYAAYVPVAGIGQPGMPGLIEGGYLPSTYADYDAYNQRHALLVRVLPPATGSTMNRVEALVTTIPNGKTVIPLRMRGRIARMIGAQGGFCASAGAGAAGVEGCSVITGTGGGWRAAASDWSVAGIAIQNGSVQAVVNSGDNAVLSDYLNRNNVGDPAANTMNTTIYSNAPAGNYALQADPTTGQTTLQIGPNINVPGTAKIGACGDQPNQAGDLVACNNVVASQFVDRDNPNYKVDPDKTSHLKQMDITDTVVSTTDGGDRLNGTNLRLRDLLPRYVAQDGFIATNENNQTAVAVPNCGSGGTPRILLQPMQDSYGFDLNQVIKTVKPNDYLVASNGAGNSVSRPALTDVQCNAGGCGKSTEGFLSDQMVGTRQAVSDMTIGSVQLYRQYAAAGPYNIGGVNSWEVSLAGTPASPTAGGGTIPWRVLAMTYCFY